ncbi:hypothetical protein [Acetobacterium bakii]|uniref:hypothetical protein n=1 Tax=Acetobacterium bakii TaxID=52689 RepID=UPI001364CFF0|nr:hypothetical protein [Acetobacterium bakii]
MSASRRTGIACVIMLPTTIYHRPPDGFANKQKVSPEDNRNISCRHHGEQAVVCPIMQPTAIYHCPQDGYVDKIKELIQFTLNKFFCFGRIIRTGSKTKQFPEKDPALERITDESKAQIHKTRHDRNFYCYAILCFELPVHHHDQP